MTMLASVAALLVALGLLASLVMAIAQRAFLQAAPPPPPSGLPPISILKPLKGVDANLKENLRSLFRQDYPAFEIILGTEDAADPALLVAQRVAGEFPQVRAIVLSDSASLGWNPKVNNLANLQKRASHPLILISDSNVRAPADYLKDLVAHRERAGGGLVWSLFRGTNAEGLGGALESLQLNGAVMGGVSALLRLFKIPCAVGKSMLLGLGDLEAVGGFPYLVQFLAEDQVCAEELAKLGRPVTASGHVIDNVLGPKTLAEFVGRHLRWARLRRHVHLGGYLGEALLNPSFLAVAAFLAVRTEESALVAGLAVAAMSLLSRSTERLLGIRRPLFIYPGLELALSTLRGILWFVPFFSSTVDWRGNLLAIGPRSRIELKSKAAPALAPEPAMFDTRERHAPA